MTRSGLLSRIASVALIGLVAVIAAVAARAQTELAPAPTITAGPSDPTNSPIAVFEWAVQEGLTYMCRLDIAEFASCTSPHAIDALSEGPHVFQVKAVESGIDSEVTSYAWTIDRTPPATSLVNYPANPSNDVSPEFEFASSEPESTFECRIDSGSFATCASAYSISVSAGTHTFSVRATDEAGNIDVTPASYTWIVDTTVPSTPRLRSKPHDPTNDPTARFSWEDQPGVTFECTVDAATEACTAPYTTDPLSEGGHTFELRAKDAAGNLSGPATWAWTVDFTPPTNVTGAPERVPDANGWYNHAVDIVFIGDDAVSGIETCSRINYDGPPGAGLTVSGVCTDNAGNASDPAVSSTFNYDAAPPTGVTGAPTGTPVNGWYGTPVVVAFSGSDATSGIQTCTNTTYSGPDGTGITVEGTCTDNAGNTSLPALSSAFKYDGSPPEVNVASPADASATADTTPLFRGTTNNGPADANTVRVSVSGPTPLTLDVPVASDGSWAVTPAVELLPGGYQIRATQTDALGRSDTSPVHAFIVDPALPRVQVSTPKHGTVTSDASLTIAGTAGTGATFAPTVTVRIYAGTTVSGAPVLELSRSVSSGGWSTVTPPLADARYTIVAEQADLAGGTASDAVVVEIDTTPPTPLTSVTRVAGYGYVKLHWTRPLSWETTDKVVITKRRVGSSAVTTIYRGTGTLLRDGRVRNGDTYVYTFVPRDAAGNAGSSVGKRARPSGFLAPRHGAHALDPPLIRWVDVRKSTYANIQLYLLTSAGMKKIWSVWPVADRLQLRSRWAYKGRTYRLRADRRYRVYGWPGYGAKSRHDYGEWFGWVDFTYR